ncbi:hypothetical protein TRVL_02638 [Trypanosoma vivax]|nr:hypothetical protein TRVL_02638 [Trypanosoma vivax]
MWAFGAPKDFRGEAWAFRRSCHERRDIRVRRRARAAPRIGCCVRSGKRARGHAVNDTATQQRDVRRKGMKSAHCIGGVHVMALVQHTGAGDGKNSTKKNKRSEVEGAIQASWSAEMHGAQSTGHSDAQAITNGRFR